MSETATTPTEATTEATRPFYVEVTLSVAAWGMLRTTRRYYATAEEAMIGAAVYTQGRIDRERQEGNDPTLSAPAMATLGSEYVIRADRSGRVLHRNQWVVTTGTL